MNSVWNICHSGYDFTPFVKADTAKYAEIDARYQSTKAERTAMKKQIQQAGKKIKNLDNAKNKIRKNFERKSNT